MSDCRYQRLFLVDWPGEGVCLACLGFGGLGFRVEVLGFRVWGGGWTSDDFVVGVQGLELGVKGAGMRACES